MGKTTKAAKQRDPLTAEQALAATMPKGTVLPTKEWLERYNHSATSPTNASGQKVGRATLREPWFESLVKRDWKEANAEKRPAIFTVENLQALRSYRNQFEAANRSETRSCLNVSNGGRSSGGGKGDPSLSVMAAKRWLGMVEPAIGAIIDTLRAVAIDDQSYQAVAMARFGSRAADFYDKDTGAFTVRYVPKSGRHPLRVKAEFVDAVRRLTDAVSGHRAAANANGPVALGDDGLPIESVRQFNLTDTLRAEIQRRADAGRPVGSIDIPLVFLRDICRENGLPPPPESTAEAEFEGIPMRVFADRFLGWVLKDGEVE